MTHNTDTIKQFKNVEKFDVDSEMSKRMASMGTELGGYVESTEYRKLLAAYEDLVIQFEDLKKSKKVEPVFGSVCV